MSSPTVVRSPSPRRTEQIAFKLAQALGPNGLVLLEGDLGSGKTVFVRGLARALGIDPKQIRSPTFTLAQEFDGKVGKLIHMDLYRLQPEDVERSELLERLLEPGLVAVEWAERLPWVPPQAWRVLLVRTGKTVREIRIVAPDRSKDGL